MRLLASLRTFLGGSSYTVKRASALLAVSAILSNVLGLVRNLVFLRLIPIHDLDIYYASFRIPDFLFNIIIFGAVSSAFVPVVSELLAKGEEKQADTTSNQLLSWLTLTFLGMAVVLFFAMRPVMHYVVPGFDPARFEQVVLMSRILLAQSVFFAWSFTIGGYLNSKKRFATYAMAPLVYNITLIIGGFLGSRFGLTVMAWTVVVGSLFHFLIQFNELWRTGYRPRLNFHISPELRTIVRLMLPRSVSQGIGQLVGVVYVALASSLISGSIAVYTSMNDLQTAPTMIVANSLAVAFFPTMTALMASEEWDKASQLLQKIFRSSLFLLLPSIVYCYVTRAQIVRLYFGIGRANWELTTLAIETFVIFLLGIIPAAFVTLLSRIFYSMKNTRTPMLVSAFAAAVSIVYAYVAIKVLGGSVAQLAMASVVLSVTQAVIFLVVLYKHPNFHLGLRPIIPHIESYLVGSFIMGICTYATLHVINWLYEQFKWTSTHTIPGLFIQLVLATLVGITVYLRYSKGRHDQELQWIINRNSSRNQP